jgi:hypothetical protein
MRAAAFACAMLALLLTAAPAVAAPSRWFSYDPAKIEQARARIAAGDPLYQPSYVALLKTADRALTKANPSVADKSLTPASGNKHDYFSFGPYWWRNPNTPNGLPYIRKDGQTNPDSKTDATDSVRLASFSSDVRALALAYTFTRDPKYAVKAAEMLRVWFVAPATRMNPNMTYAQAIPGIVDGRGIGIIDSRAFIDVMDAVELIRPSNALREIDYQAIRLWYRIFDLWLLASENGFEEGNWHNNHGTWYDAQVVAFSLFTDQQELAKRQLKIAALRRVAGQFDKDGRQVAELERTRPFHYSQFNLQAFSRLGRYAELVDAGLTNGDTDPTDLWQFSLDSHGLKAGYAFVAGYINAAGNLDASWPYPELTAGDGLDEAVGNLLAAARAYKDPVFRQKAATLLARYPGQIEALLLPLE